MCACRSNTAIRRFPSSLSPLIRQPTRLSSLGLDKELFCFIAQPILFLCRAYRDYYALRVQYLSNKQPQGYTVLVKEMPADGATEEALMKTFNDASRGQVNYATVAKQVCALPYAGSRIITLPYLFSR